VVSPVIGKTRDSQITVSRGSKLLRDRHDKSTFFEIDGLVLLTNQEFREFESAFDLNGRPVINFRLSEAGTHVLDVHIKNEPNGIVAFVLDGEVVSVMMNSRVRIPSNKGTIIGEFTLDEADRLTRLLNVGSLPFGLDLVQYREISPPLSINQ
jgi:preprotein translocase subunit SecD